MLPRDIMPPAPSPHNALAAMKLVMLWAREHHIVAKKKIVKVKMYGGLRPMVSDSLPNIGWNAVDVRRNAVESQEALFALLK